MLRSLLLFAVLVGAHLDAAVPFTLSHNHHFPSSRTTPRASQASSLHSSSHDTSDSHNNEIYIVSVDDVIIDTTERRIQQGIDAALKTWPELKDLLRSNGDDSSWLVNKMAALSHCMTTRTGYSSTCDYALLTRLLLEEQELDKGRSVGKTGKYASRFHPSSSSNDDDDDESSSVSTATRSSSNNNHSRPLTVGEIEVNWADGACLSETVMTRYNVNGKNPLPVIQENINRQAVVENNLDWDDVPPRANTIVCDALSECSGNAILRVGHSSDLETVQRVLQDTSLCNMPVVSSIEDALGTLSTSTTSGARLCLLVNDEMMSTTNIFRHVLTSAPPQSTLHVIDGLWDNIQKAKILFGDYIPRGVGGIGKSAFGDEQHLSLHLWTDRNSNSLLQSNNAEMDPWTNVMNQQDLLNLVAGCEKVTSGE